MKIIKSLLCIFLAGIFAVQSATAAKSHVLEFNISSGGSTLPASARLSMEQNLVKLLTMMSDAQAKDSKTLDFSGISITPDAKSAILLLWKYNHMRVGTDQERGVRSISEKLLNMQNVGNYQIRNIPVCLFPTESPGTCKRSEISVNFSRTGTITDLNLTMERQQYDSLIEGVVNVQEQQNIMMLVHWMDQLRTAYETKNLEYLMSLFDEKAVIITGVRTSKLTQMDNNVFKNKETFDYYIYNKGQYRTKMSNVFRNNKEVNVNFLEQQYGYNDMISVVDADGNETPRYYMVWCTQQWMASNYQDVGRLFVLWDFKNPEEPRIMVRAWTNPDDPKQFSEDDFILSTD